MSLWILIRRTPLISMHVLWMQVWHDWIYWTEICLRTYEDIRPQVQGVAHIGVELERKSRIHETELQRIIKSKLNYRM